MDTELTVDRSMEQMSMTRGTVNGEMFIGNFKFEFFN
jgi:hypothetical protein